MTTEVATSKPSTYAQRLSRHIDDYLRVVIDEPDARMREFTELARFASMDNPARLLEMPAEGRMLDLLYPRAAVCHCDMLATHVDGYSENLKITDWSLSGIESGLYDGVLAVVPFHHADLREKLAYLAGAWNALAPGGVLAFGEVQEGSDVHGFLDEFLDGHTETGHRGAYVDAEFADHLKRQGFAEVATELRSCPWEFVSDEALCAYFNRLFHFRPLSNDYLIDSIERYLGIERGAGRVSVNWSLRYFRGVKPA